MLDAVLDVFLLHGLLQADGHGFHIAPGHAAVAGHALKDDDQLLGGGEQLLIVDAQEAADVGDAVLLALMVQPSE